MSIIKYSAHDVQVTAAFMSQGLPHGEAFQRLLVLWDQGCIELITEMTSYADFVWGYIAKNFDNKDFPGVLDYEVSETFGGWFASMIMIDEKHEPPTKNQCETYLRGEIDKFFAQP
jgi:hypothetical protein